MLLQTDQRRGPDVYEECSGWLHVDRSQEFWLILGHAQAAVGPTLELCSGAGRITQSLAREQVTVVGLELSDSMLAKAQERREKACDAIRSRLTYVKGDMRNFHLDARFGLVFVAFCTFWRHLTPETAIGCLACIKDALLPGGLFLIDTPQVGYPDFPSFWQDASDQLKFSWQEFRYHPNPGQTGAMMIGQFHRS